MTRVTPPQGLGVIEGFFGREWSWPVRAGLAGFLKETGYDFYIYAPKADPYLRKRWREPLPEAALARLAETAAAYRAAGLAFGIGLSPFELYLHPDGAAQADLRSKVAQINEIGPDLLCILFDDMRGDLPQLAELQARILGQITELSGAGRFVFCPTYYSDDPVLDKVFGARPATYLADLGRRLDPRIEVFWTGPQVCSTAYPAAHLERVAEALGRKPFLWDNYPVNDSAKMSNFLHLRAFRDRPATLRDLLSGHAVNPMNQAWLSRIPLATLAESYRLGETYDPDAAFETACRQLCGPELGAALSEDLPAFQDRGLANLTAGESAALIARYSRFDGDPFAAELVAWLKGEYEFDPACLTD